MRTTTGPSRFKALIAICAALALAGMPGALAARAPSAIAATTEAEHPRFIPMAGGRNFRDVGGYRTASGKTVRWGMMYRSGALGSLKPEGKMMLAGLHPAAIIDLRTSEERGRDADGWIAARPGYWSRNYSMSMGNLGSRFAKPGGVDAGAMREMMLSGYRSFPIEQASGYRELFAGLVAGKGPVVVNCSAGKDRTGIASALVLTALGVPYETVRQDFLLSNGAPGMETLAGGLSGPLGKLPPDVAAVILGVEPGYLDTAFATIRKDYGSVDAYLAKELGVGPRERAALRHRMLR